MGLGAIPRIVAVNKVDAADPAATRRLLGLTGGVAVSAARNEGMDALVERLGVVIARAAGRS
jgi:GTP-binding protein HflX